MKTAAFLFLSLYFLFSIPASFGQTKEVVVDNGSAGTFSTGIWKESSSAGFYGSNSLWASDGATYSWHADLPESGNYKVYIWWTDRESRSAQVPVDITYAAGTRRLYLNQKVNGGRWKYLGTFGFDAAAGATVKLTAANSAPETYCADAVRFVEALVGNLKPTAVIDLIAPNPGGSGQTIVLRGHGNDNDGTITGYSWRADSGTEGSLAQTDTAEVKDLKDGIHTIYFKVKDSMGLWSEEVRRAVKIGGDVEHIYYILGYAETNTELHVIQMMTAMGGVKNGSVWVYKRGDKTFYIHFIKTPAGMKKALMSEGAHIIYTGHASYGLGAVFANELEHNNQAIGSIRTIDDDRILKFSSRWISVDLPYIRKHHAYPKFWPIFKDGTSAVMPYRLDDPAGTPPYNYYLTYRVADDPTFYKAGRGIERFVSTDSPAWYSPSGEEPNPADPDHQKYFLANSRAWSMYTETAGTWEELKTNNGYYNENYIRAPPGDGDLQFKWKFTIPKEGDYNIAAWWPAHSNHATDAPYTVTGPEPLTVRMNQRINGHRWNDLGKFHLKPGDYAVVLTNATQSGYVAADAVRVAHVSNPPEIVQANFRASPLYGTAPLDVRFINQSLGYMERQWDFGDGKTNNSQDDINHVYSSPGLYSVELSVNSSIGNSNKSRTALISVGSPHTQADFSSDGSQTVILGSSVLFRDRSGGNIVSRSWDFGDGKTSTDQNPKHTYLKTGNYTVSLTVKDSAEKESTTAKENFIRVVVYEKNIDNVDYPLKHYRAGTILFRRDADILESDLRYTRMFYNSCNSGNYFIETFHRGIMFYTLGTPAEIEAVRYLQAYLDGKTDKEIWQILQNDFPVFDYYNFNKKPQEQ